MAPHTLGEEKAVQQRIPPCAGSLVGKSAKQLNGRQAALLAVTLPNPYARDPAHPGPGLKRLASLIQRRVANAGGLLNCLRANGGW